MQFKGKRQKSLSKSALFGNYVRYYRLRDETSTDGGITSIPSEVIYRLYNFLGNVGHTYRPVHLDIIHNEKPYTISRYERFEEEGYLHCFRVYTAQIVDDISPAYWDLKATTTNVCTCTFGAYVKSEYTPAEDVIVCDIGPVDGTMQFTFTDEQKARAMEVARNFADGKIAKIRMVAYGFPLTCIAYSTKMGNTNRVDVTCTFTALDRPVPGRTIPSAIMGGLAIDLTEGGTGITSQPIRDINIFSPSNALLLTADSTTLQDTEKAVFRSNIGAGVAIPEIHDRDGAIIETLQSALLGMRSGQWEGTMSEAAKAVASQVEQAISDFPHQAVLYCYSNSSDKVPLFAFPVIQSNTEGAFYINYLYQTYQLSPAGWMVLPNPLIGPIRDGEPFCRNIGAQRELTVETKPDGNILISGLGEKPLEFMPATPSGDPMHYAYEAAGFEYNAEADRWTDDEAGRWDTEGLKRCFNANLKQALKDAASSASGTGTGK